MTVLRLYIVSQNCLTSLSQSINQFIYQNAANTVTDTKKGGCNLH